MPEDRLLLTGFPLRKQFTEVPPAVETYDGSRPLRCLMVLGSEGSTGMEENVKNLLDGTDIRLTVICRDNEEMRAALSRLQDRYPGRLEPLGFTEEIARGMREHDLLIARSSPNILFEGIAMNLPIVAVSVLKAQEEGNDRLIASRNLGVRCADYPDLKSAVLALAEPEKYRRVRAAQRDYYTPGGAERIAGLLLEML
jgi:UDP-N-acetylglucosamine:LPS N-acetylglucosamine transferase